MGKKNKKSKGEGNQGSQTAKNSQGRSSEPLTGYLKELFTYNEKTKKYLCCICPPGENAVERKNINRHVTKSVSHRFKTPPEQIPSLDKLVAEINGNIENIRSKKGNHNNLDALKRNYLEFLTFCYKSNYSFAQITQLLQFLKLMAKNQKLKFFTMFSFNEEEISTISNELRHCLLEELKEDLSNSPYSLSLDNVTVNGTNICGLKVRYLKEYEEKLKGSNGLQTTIKRRKIENNIIGIKYLKGESSAQILLDIVREKLLNLDPKIKNNMIGFTHDMASNLSSKYNGLSALLTEELPQKFFDLPDPCHALNLCLSKSLQTLLEEMLSFTTKIHAYFSSPQRKERLKIAQIEGNLDVLLLKKYVETRWLSLGESLNRLLIL